MVEKAKLPFSIVRWRCLSRLGDVAEMALPPMVDTETDEGEGGCMQTDILNF
jgi:hypothetical protein